MKTSPDASAAFRTILVLPLNQSTALKKILIAIYNVMNAKPGST
jgi:hypothetical protein